MRMMTCPALAAVILAGVLIDAGASFVGASGPTAMARADDVVALALTDKRTVRGTLLGLVDGKVRLEGKSGPLLIPFGELTMGAARTVATRLSKQLTAAADLILLGELELRCARWERARAAYKRASEADSTYVTAQQVEEGQREADRLEARSLYQAGVDAQQARKPKAARAAFSEVRRRFPSSTYAEAAAKLLAVLDADDPNAGNKPVKPKPARPDKVVTPKPTVSRRHARSLKQLEYNREQIDQHRKNAFKLEAAGRQTRSIRELETALEKIEALELFARKLAGLDDDVVSKRANEILGELDELKIELHLQLGHQFAGMDQFRQATYHVNQILLEQPDHTKARALRERITYEQIRRVGKRDNK